MQRGLVVKSIPQYANTDKLAFMERQNRQNAARHDAEVQFTKNLLKASKPKTELKGRFEDLPDMEFRGLE